jgi:hypothetical protein
MNTKRMWAGGGWVKYVYRELQKRRPKYPLPNDKLDNRELPNAQRGSMKPVSGRKKEASHPEAVVWTAGFGFGSDPLKRPHKICGGKGELRGPVKQGWRARALFHSANRGKRVEQVVWESGRYHKNQYDWAT